MRFQFAPAFHNILRSLPAMFAELSIKLLGLPHTEILELQYNSGPSLLHPHHLRQLKIAGCSGITDMMLNTFFLNEKFARLTHLSLNRLFFRVNKKFLSNSPTSEQLTLPYCDIGPRSQSTGEHSRLRSFLYYYSKKKMIYIA